MNSLWISQLNTSKINNQINDNYSADVCIIGTGITGLSTAYYLVKSGFKVIIIDKSGIGEKTSGHTTAKITLQHGLIYNYLINTYGYNYALNYFKANKKAIFDIKEIIDTENIDCDFEFKNNYIYTTLQNDITKIKKEIVAINSLANEDYAYFLSDIDLTFKNLGAIKTKNQAQFNPVKYMYGLANSILNSGGQIFTNSPAFDVQKNDTRYITYSGDYTIKSKYLIIASHYPFINFPGFYFSKMYQSTSYAIAIETNKKIPDGMYINTCEPILSFRTAKYNGEDLLILSGGDHKTGYSPESEPFYGYSFLEHEAKKYYPDCKILYKWDTRDCITLVKVPYIGEFSKFMPNAYVATGFNKWGMTSSNIAANIIKDKILGQKNIYADTFDSSRFKPIKNRNELKNMASQVFKSFVSNRLKIPEKDLSSIKNDNGGIIHFNGTDIGIYKDKKGKIYAVNPTCTHLGCLLTWNNVDKTWDCPCHGSRFDYKGKNLYDPAFRDLDTYGIN